ncbi:MAG: response regulator transcription factor [Planctomycetota bacterium]|jgi:FixJ family two-component response regulator
MTTTLTVFVVDRDPLARSAVRHAAGLLNMQCEPYVSGGEFLDALDPSKPGCVVLEVRLPDMSGFEIQRHLLVEAPAMPVVFLAGRATVSIAVRAMRAGAIHFLEKPVRENELWDVLHEAAHVNQRRRRSHRQKERSIRRLGALSDKQRQLLDMILAGDSNRAMASKLGVCLRTVELRRAKLSQTLQVESLTELLQLALVANNGDVPELCEAAYR